MNKMLCTATLAALLTSCLLFASCQSAPQGRSFQEGESVAIHSIWLNERNRLPSEGRLKKVLVSGESVGLYHEDDKVTAVYSYSFEVPEGMAPPEAGIKADPFRGHIAIYTTLGVIDQGCCLRLCPLPLSYEAATGSNLSFTAFRKFDLGAVPERCREGENVAIVFVIGGSIFWMPLNELIQSNGVPD